MKKISEHEILHRIGLENPWWQAPGKVDESIRGMTPRAYLGKFDKLLRLREPNRAIVLMGPRRVGKSVLIHHAIQQLIDGGVDARRVCYISIDAPVYTGQSLETLLRHYARAHDLGGLDGSFVFFDEIQYLPEWERHLKKLVEDHPGVKFVASGSAAAALRLKSNESGAGRFTDFRLPPLTFHEFLLLSGKAGLVKTTDAWHRYDSDDLPALNDEFINYLNYGGYPEAITSPAVRKDPQRFIKTDIIDKVLLRDLPSLYGIADIQELNRLFTLLAYNTGQEASLDELSQGAGVAKNTIKRYMEYLSAAFLVHEVHRVDYALKFFKRANFFKIYLSNPSMRAALFGPIDAGHDFAGHLAESAVMSQVTHADGGLNIYYARWSKGEIDIVQHDGRRATICVEIKWSNRAVTHTSDEIGPMLQFMEKNHVSSGIVTTRDVTERRRIGGVGVDFIPCSLYCYGRGRRILGI